MYQGAAWGVRLGSQGVRKPLIYDGVGPRGALEVIYKILKPILYLTGSQCSEARITEIWSRFFFEFDSFEFFEFDSSLTAELWMSYRWEKTL